MAHKDDAPLSELLHGSDPLVLLVPGQAPFSIRRAGTFWSRFAGLMGRREGDWGLWISPCDAIHMMFMRFALDVVFLDRRGTIVSIRTGVKPWGMAFGGKGAHSVIELPASRNLTRGLTPGMRVPLAVAEPSA